MSDIFGEEDVPDFEAAQVEQTPEPVEEPAQAEVPAPDVGADSRVPLAALNEARAQLRHTQSEMQQMREQLQQFQAMKAEVDEWRNRQKAQQEEQQFNQDPLGMIQKQLRELETKVVQPQQRAEQDQSQQQTFMSIASQVNEFKKTTPDYDDALQFVLEARKQEWLAMGTPEYEAQQRIAQEAQDIAVNALRTGQNPGKVVYELAKLRGFTAKQTAAKLETIGKGQQAAKSLSGSSGGADTGDISLAEVDRMDDEEFDKWWSKNMKPNRR